MGSEMCIRDRPSSVRRCDTPLGLRVGLLLGRAPVPGLQVGLGDLCGACGARAVRPRCYGRSHRVVARGVVLGGSLLQASMRQRGKRCATVGSWGLRLPIMACQCTARRLLGPGAPFAACPRSWGFWHPILTHPRGTAPAGPFHCCSYRFGAVTAACFWWLPEAPRRWSGRRPMPRARAAKQWRWEHPRPVR